VASLPRSRDGALKAANDLGQFLLRDGFSSQGTSPEFCGGLAANGRPE
jgi:hypothetical protein